MEEGGDGYLVIVDYCSRYFLAERLLDTTSRNGPQFTSEQFKGLVRNRQLSTEPVLPNMLSQMEKQKEVYRFLRD